MEPRAFVVMPFGQKAPRHEIRIPDAPVCERTLDFERIFETLLKPALQRAGYEVARGDSAANAGDIRTDMFFELVTADFVVADVSILNANVYYELGVRHGVCPRGVFVISADLGGPIPFDVAPDRRFTYDASAFISPEPCTIATGMRADEGIEKEVERLAKKFRDATTVDHQTVGSPVYAHLPGLRPVDWTNIETSKAKDFNALQSDWMDCVRVAQAHGRPGDILTLARNAPTLQHEARILFETAVALIDLCRYAAAEAVPTEVLRLQPDHPEAQLHLALVAAQRGLTPIAEHRLRRILKSHRADSRADDLLGQVFRGLWRLSWRDVTIRSPGASRRPNRRNWLSLQFAVSRVHIARTAANISPASTA